MQLAEAQRLALRLVTLLQPVCVEITIAGSIRREKAAVKDIEIVALPDWTVPKLAFGEPARRNVLERHLDTLFRGGVLRPGDKDGPRYKTLDYQGATVDLFLAADDNYGNTLAIRTGDKDFSHYLVTDRRRGGLMPDLMRQRRGYLWRLRAGYEMADDASDDEAWEKLSCPDEATFFATLGFDDVPDPTVRDAGFARALAAGRRAA